MNGGSGSEFFASDSAGKGNVSWEQSESLGMMSAKVGVFEQVDHSGLTGFLESKQG